MTTPVPTPRFSVIVPTFQRPDSLERCLAALAEQDIGRERFEVLVVDDGSAISPQAVVDRFHDRLALRLLRQANAGPASARNAGAAAARGELVVFTDDDCLPEPGWLSALTVAASRHPGCAIGGRVDNSLADGLYSTSSQLLIDFLYGYYNRADGDARFFITSNLALPTASFRMLGGFDTSFPLAAAEDRDLCDRWREQGRAMIYADDAVVRHAHALGFRSFCRQHFNYGRGAYHLHVARTRRGERPLRVEPIGNFYVRLAWYPIGRATGFRAVALSALAVLSQVVYVAGYLLERGFGRARRPGRPTTTAAST